MRFDQDFINSLPEIFDRHGNIQLFTTELQCKDENEERPEFMAFGFNAHAISGTMRELQKIPRACAAM